MTLRSGNDDLRRLHELLAALYGLGVPIDWAQVFTDVVPRTSRAVVAPLLPTYPFQRER
jgi:acyl transferase domain-containing protein